MTMFGNTRRGNRGWRPSLSTFGPAITSLGKIVVDVEQVVFHAFNPRVFAVPNMPPLNVHEPAKEGIVHGTQWERELSLYLIYALIIHAKSRLGEEVSAPAIMSMASVTTIRNLVSFRFKYRALGEP